MCGFRSRHVVLVALEEAACRLAESASWHNLCGMQFMTYDGGDVAWVGHLTRALFRLLIQREYIV